MRSLFVSSLLALIHGLSSVPTALPQPTLHDLLVSSRNSHAVLRFDGETGTFVDALVGSRAGGLDSTQEILLDRGGDLLVTGRGNRSVLRFDRLTGAPRGSFSTGYVLDAPTKMSWGPDGDLYVSQWGDRTGQTTVAVFDGETGAFLREATPDLDRPMDHAWDEAGTLHVVSFGSRDVRRYAADGTLIDVFVAPSPRLQGPVNLWFDEAGDRLVIADWATGTIQRYDADDGSFLDTLVAGLQNVEGRAVGPDGALYLGEWGADRVRRFDAATGNSLGIFARGGGLGAPNSLLFVERLPDFGLSTSTTSVTLPQGGEGQVSLEVRPLRGVPFDEEIALACASPSSRLACSVEPSAVTPGPTPALAVLQLSDAGATNTSRREVAGLALLALGSVALGLARGKRRLRRGAIVWGLALVVLLSCGGSGGSTIGPDPDPMPDPAPDPGPDPAPAPEVVRVEVTGASGDLERTSTVTVTLE